MKQQGELYYFIKKGLIGEECRSSRESEVMT